MKLEIVLLLQSGMKPQQVAELVDTTKWNVYHYNRKLKEAKELVGTMNLKKK